MARLPRLAASGHAHLLRQRGNNGQAVFVDADDRERYLVLLRDAALAHGVGIHAYALTDDSVTLLATPDSATGLSRMMQALGRGYVAAFNRRHGRSGTLWEGRFRSAVVEPETRLLEAMVFVETGATEAPTTAGDPLPPRWSSARHHLGLGNDPLVADHPHYWTIGNTPFEREAVHRRLLERGLAESARHAIATALQGGWALGSAGFAAGLAEHVGRRVLPRQRGRPRKLKRNAGSD